MKKDEEEEEDEVEVKCSECGTIFEKGDSVYLCDECGEVVCGDCIEEHGQECVTSEAEDSCNECGNDVYRCNRCGELICSSDCMDEHISTEMENLYEEYDYDDYVSEKVVESI